MTTPQVDVCTFDDDRDEIAQIVRERADRAREAFGGELPEGFTIKKRRYGRSGYRWVGKTKGVSVIEVSASADRLDALYDEMWWLVWCATADNAGRIKASIAIREAADAE